jgi:2-polyprenyl-3-methyl-5-hydroxy-6-metoxy-1,4-benzoquinol methylase
VSEERCVISLDARDRQPELMDQPGLDRQVHRQALDGLRRVNAISRTACVLWQGLEAVDAFSATGPLRVGPLRVLDVGAGGGDVVIGLAQLARRYGIALEVDGCDINVTALAHAELSAEKAGVRGVRFFELDAIRGTLPTDYDVLTCTLFLHHFPEADARDLMRRMAAAARRAVLIDDLVRSRLGYTLAWLGGRIITGSTLVHVDGPLSVRAAFRLDEVRQLADQAGMKDASIRRHWPERYLLAWRKP